MHTFDRTKRELLADGAKAVAEIASEAANKKRNMIEVDRNQRKCKTTDIGSQTITPADFTNLVCKHITVELHLSKDAADSGSKTYFFFEKFLFRIKDRRDAVTQLHSYTVTQRTTKEMSSEAFSLLRCYSMQKKL